MFMERLPSEVLMKIVSYLDASSLICISLVNKLFHQLSSYDAFWHRMYLSETGKKKQWKPKCTGPMLQNLGTVRDRTAGYWKRLYIKMMAGHHMDKWKMELQAKNPYTGLPCQTEWVLRNLHVRWDLAISVETGQERTFEPTQVHFFQSSVAVGWSPSCWPLFTQMSTLQLHGVRREALQCPSMKKLGWQSLMGKFDAETLSKRSQVIGTDSLVKLVLLQPGLIIGTWRGHGAIAFVIACFHFHRVVERSLLGSFMCPYSVPVDKAPFDDIDPDYGLHGYTLHIVLHNTVTEIMSGHFPRLFCRRVEIHDGLIQLVAISRTNLSQHTSLSGGITLPWKCEALEGTVENCCLMSLTLLDEAQIPFWCVSSPVAMVPAKKPISYDYDGKHFVIQYGDSEGRVQMDLAWMEELRQYFLINLTVYMSLHKVNGHFGRTY